MTGCSSGLYGRSLEALCIDTSTRAQRTSPKFGRHMQKLHIVFRLLPGMFLRDKNILIKIK